MNVGLYKRYNLRIMWDDDVYLESKVVAASGGRAFCGWDGIAWNVFLFLSSLVDRRLSIVDGWMPDTLVSVGLEGFPLPFGMMHLRSVVSIFSMYVLSFQTCDTL